jgi:hypothetical protein
VECELLHDPAMRALWLVLLIAACGGGQCPPGQTCVGPDDDDDVVVGDRCMQLPGLIEDEVVARGSCVTDNDCTIVGGQFDQPTCNCAAAVLDCGGHAIESNAPGVATARALIAELAECGPFNCTDGIVPCICDCSPNVARCGRDGRCFAEPIGSCFPPPQPDAGVD